MNVWQTSDHDVPDTLSAPLPQPSTMDYSSSLNDPENPVEASPWGTSPVVSSQNNGNGNAFASTKSDVPTSPYRETRSRDGQYPNSAMNQNYNHAGSSFAGSVTDDSTDGGRPDTADSMLPPPATTDDDDDTPGQQPQLTHEQRQQPVRQQSRQAPQYKLQAKITNLERTGRKDPIMRFDVYVGIVPVIHSRIIDCVSDKPSSLSNYSIS